MTVMKEVEKNMAATSVPGPIAPFDDADIDAEELDGADDGGSGELYEHFRFTVDKGQQLLRIDKYLVTRLEKSSRNRI